MQDYQEEYLNQEAIKYKKLWLYVLLTAIQEEGHAFLENNEKDFNALCEILGIPPEVLIKYLWEVKWDVSNLLTEIGK